MYKRDLVTAEIQKLAQVLAKIMGLKLELQLEEADALFKQTLEKDFGLPLHVLTDEDSSAFTNWLNTQELPPEKLDLLSHFIFSTLDPDAAFSENKALAHKLNLIYDLLETRYRVVHLINLNRQKLIQQYL